MNKRIHERGYLPHWDFKQSFQALTFRLADSVPKQLLHEWKQELNALSEEGVAMRQLRLRIAKYEDIGMGDCVLGKPECAQLIQEQFFKGHAVDYKLIAWVVMPNHVHVLIRLLKETSLSDVVKMWKGAAIQINRIIGRIGRLWEPDYYDRYIRDLDHYHEAITYIHSNPVRAKLSRIPEEWPYSSAAVKWDPERGL